MNLKVATLVAFIGSIAYAVYDTCFLIIRLNGGRIQLGTFYGVLELAEVLFPVSLAIFFFTLWRKQK